MSPRTTLVRLGILAAGGALAALAAAGPAVALDSAGDAGTNAPVYKGRVTAKSGLLLHTSPTRGSKVIRTVPRGKVVTIFCKTRGDRVVNNNIWYLLTDGSWAWGSAHYIANIGKVPRWC